MPNRSCTTYFKNLNTPFSSMTMNPNNFQVMGNQSPNTSINEVDIFNTNVHELLSLTNDPGFSDHQPPQFQFPSFFTNDIPNSSLNYESIADFFYPDEGSNMGDNGLLHNDYGNYLQNSSSQTATYGVVPNNQGYGGKKRKRNKGREVEKLREVVHVRAKRGQATDSHSLAERSRREKINEKLRCLQDLVPGCYKTMGMAVMLDVITNYVRSLQNQIDFLSMKLSAASLFYDFNSSDMATVEQCREKDYAYEEQALEKMMGGGGRYVMQPQFYNSLPY